MAARMSRLWLNYFLLPLLLGLVASETVVLGFRFA